MNRSHQFTLSIFSICLIILLSLSTVNKTIHDGLFHQNLVTENNTNSSKCSGNHEGVCNSNETNSHSQSCDASCPVNIFSNGVLTLDYIPEIRIHTPAQRGVVTDHSISHFIKEVKKSHLVRGPPIGKQV